MKKRDKVTNDMFEPFSIAVSTNQSEDFPKRSFDRFFPDSREAGSVQKGGDYVHF